VEHDYKFINAGPYTPNVIRGQRKAIRRLKAQHPHSHADRERLATYEAGLRYMEEHAA
jgi:hypothetical protein